jgi:capsular exopolysaccharide synthesis family protein
VSAPPTNAGSGQDTLDLRGLWFAVRRRASVIGAIVAACTLLAAFLTSQIEDVYTAGTRVLIEPQNRQIIDAKSAADPRPDSTLMDTEVELILSRDMINQVVSKLNLAADPEFNPRLKEAKQGLSVPNPSEVSVAEAPGAISGTDDERSFNVENALVADALQQKITAFREGLTFVISINAESADPEKAALIANTLTSIYISGQLNSKVDETLKAGEWLQERLGVLREDVREAESAVQEYRTAQGLVEAGGISTIEAKLASLTSQDLVLQADLMEKKLRYDEATRYADADALTAQSSDVVSSPLLTTLRSQQSDLAREFADVLTKYSPLHPEYIRLTNQIAELDGNIEAERSRILSSLRSDVQVAQSRANAVELELRNLSNQLNNNNRDMIKQRELEREATASREIYEDLLSRSEQVTQSAQLQRSDAHLVSAAEPPAKPSSPNHKLNIALGVLAGFALAGCIAVFLEMFEKGIVSADDVERHLALPLIVTVPEVPKRHPFKKSTGGQLSRYMVTKNRSVFSEAIRTLFHTVFRTGRQSGPLAVALTSALPGEGKTTLTHCLALLAATQGQRVLIIDGDLHRHTISEALAPNAKLGLLEVLQGKLDASKAIIPLKQENLSILPVSNLSTDAGLVVTREKCEALFLSLKTHYDLILIDCPPALPVLEARVIGSAADGLVFAARWRKTHRKAVSMAIRLLSNEGAHILGVVMTRADLKAKSLYEDFGGSHYKLYTAYYHD